MKKLLFSLLFVLAFLPIIGFAQTATNEELLDFVTKPSTNTQEKTISPELQTLLNQITADQANSLKSTYSDTSKIRQLYPGINKEDEFYLTFKEGQTLENYLKAISAENARRTALGQTNLLPNPTIQINPNIQPGSKPKPFIPQDLSNPFNDSPSRKSTNLSSGSDILDQIVPSSLFGGQPINKLLNQLFYIGLVVAVLLAIVMIIRGGVEYMTIDAIASKENGKNRIKAAMGGLLLAFSAILILNTINPGLTSLSIKFEQLKQIKGVTIGGITSGMRGANVGGTYVGEGAINPSLTAYSPQKNGSTMEGGYASSKPGLDGKSLVRTLDDYANGGSGYITLAGDPSLYGKSYTIPQITYKNSTGQTVTLTNVKGYVHDTGSAFTGKGSSRIDIPVGKDYSSSALNSQPFSKQTIEFIPAE